MEVTGKYEGTDLNRPVSELEVIGYAEQQRAYAFCPLNFKSIKELGDKAVHSTTKISNILTNAQDPASILTRFRQ
jgi:hypothetical protein